MLNNLHQMNLNYFKKSNPKKAEATGDLISNKIAKRITKIFKIYNKIIQRQLQINVIKKYLKKDIYLQKKGRVLFRGRILLLILI